MEHPPPADRDQGWLWFAGRLVLVFVLLAVLFLVVATLLLALSRWREEVRKATCLNNLKQLGLAMAT